MKTVLNSTDLELQLPLTNDGAGAVPSRQRRLVLSVLVVLMPVAFLICFKACQALLGNEAFASVSEDYYPSAFFRTSDAALHDKILRNPQHIDELGTQQILALFSHPSLRRTEGPYRHWQYVSESCVMDIYMKMGSGGEPKHPVQYVDFRPRHTAYYQPAKADAGNDTVSKVDCIQSLMPARVAGLFH